MTKGVGRAENGFRPFYEWLPDRFPTPFLAKVIVSGLAGFLFLIPHYMIVGERVLEDWSWLLCLIIVTAFVCLYYATHTFRTLFPQLDLRLQAKRPPVPNSVYLDSVRWYLNDGTFLFWGAIFGILNCGVGFVLGGPDQGPWATATSYFGFFIAGFVCGMAAGGIRGVVITLSRYLDRGQPKVDYTNPDGCGGLLFLGEALIIFSAVTLVVGVLISVYIIEVKWSSLAADKFSSFVHALMWIWISFPFLLSLTILLAPASRANRVLTDHKIQMEVELAIAFDRTREALRNPDVDADRHAQLRHELEYLAEQRDQLHRMHTWPLNTKANVRFVLLFVSNAIVAIQSIRGLLQA